MLLCRKRSSLYRSRQAGARAREGFFIGLGAPDSRCILSGNELEKSTIRIVEAASRAQPNNQNPGRSASANSTSGSTRASRGLLVRRGQAPRSTFENRSSTTTALRL